MRDKPWTWGKCLQKAYLSIHRISYFAIAVAGKKSHSQSNLRKKGLTSVYGSQKGLGIMAGKAWYWARVTAGAEAAHSHLYPHTGSVEGEQEARLGYKPLEMDFL